MRENFHPEIASHANAVVKAGYADGAAVFGALAIQHNTSKDIGPHGKYGQILTPKRPAEFSISIPDPSDLARIMGLTYQGFIVSARWEELEKQNVRADTFHSATLKHPLAASFGKGNPHESQTIESPSLVLTAFNHARAVLGMLQARATLSDADFQILLEDLGLQTTSEIGMDDFLRTFYSAGDGPEISPRISWAGDGSYESLINEVKRVGRIVDMALYAPVQLRPDEVMRGEQYFTLGNMLFDTALAGQDPTLSQSIADELTQLLS